MEQSHVVKHGKDREQSSEKECGSGQESSSGKECCSVLKINGDKKSRVQFKATRHMKKQKSVIGFFNKKQT